MAEGLAAGRVGAASGRRLLCDELLQCFARAAGRRKATFQHFTQVDGLGMGERALQMNHG